jgi:hypothetical protein
MTRLLIQFRLYRDGKEDPGWDVYLLRREVDQPWRVYDTATKRYRERRECEELGEPTFRMGLRQLSVYCDFAVGPLIDVEVLVSDAKRAAFAQDNAKGWPAV